MIEVIINLLALGAGVSLGVLWERRYWVSNLDALVNRMSRSIKDMD